MATITRVGVPSLPRLSAWSLILTPTSSQDRLCPYRLVQSTPPNASETLCPRALLRHRPSVPPTSGEGSFHLGCEANQTTVIRFQPRMPTVWTS